VVELAGGADGVLGEDPAQVVPDGARTEEQPRGDLGVGQAVAGQPRDLGFLRGQLGAGVNGVPAGVSPVAASSRRTRSANADTPISSSIS